MLDIGGCVSPVSLPHTGARRPCRRYGQREEAGATEQLRIDQRRDVHLTRSFYMKSTEVTQGEWPELMGNNPSYYKSCGDDCPVNNVNWYDALAYCNALSRSEAVEECYDLSSCSGTPGEEGYTCPNALALSLSCKGYRLPTEAEWEYAARAGTKTRFAGGDAESDLAVMGWYRGNSKASPHSVGQKSANGWGLCDMHGNVLEWTWDGFDEYPYKATDPVGPNSGSVRVGRGGSGSYEEDSCRSAFRGSHLMTIGTRSLGIRPVRLSKSE